MHPADIVAAIRKAGLTYGAVGRRVHGRRGRPVTESAVWAVIHGTSRSRAIADEIGRIVGVPAPDLWPHIYGPSAPAKKPRFKLRLDGSMLVIRGDRS